MDKIVIWDFTR